MSEQSLVRVENLVKHFPIRQGILFQRQIGAVKAVDGISFEIRRGETMGLVGESRLRQVHDRSDNAAAI